MAPRGQWHPLTVWACCSFFLSHTLIFLFLSILTAPSSVPSILSSFAQTPTRAKLPSWIFSQHSSTPSFFLFLQLWAENNRPEDFQSVTHQVTLGTHVLVHMFTRNESFHFMRQFILSICPPFLYFIQKNIST